MKIIPSKSQWRKWVLLNKLTYLGFILTCIGTILTIFSSYNPFTTRQFITNERNEVPKLVIKLFNHTDSTVSII